MSSRIFTTGGSGFVGSAVIGELIARGHAVNALTNRQQLHAGSNVGSDAGGDAGIDVGGDAGKDFRGKDAGNLRPIKGSLFDPGILDDGIRGCDAVIHLVGIIMPKPSKGITFERIHFEGTKAVVDAARRAGVKRYIHMSALGARPDAVSEYHKTKYKAEQYVRASGLEWTIFRPSLIHGPGGELMKMEAMWARKRAPAPLFFQPVMPYFGGKNAGLIQPVYVKDVARAFVDALENRKTIGEIYPLGGPDVMTWPQMHQMIAQAVVGHRRLVASVPVPIAKFLAAIGVAPILGFNRDQVIMSQEDNTCDLTKFKDDFGWEPQHFEPLVQEYLKQL